MNNYLLLDVRLYWGGITEATTNCEKDDWGFGFIPASPAKKHPLQSERPGSLHSFLLQFNRSWRLNKRRELFVCELVCRHYFRLWPAVYVRRLCGGIPPYTFSLQICEVQLRSRLISRTAHLIWNRRHDMAVYSCRPRRGLPWPAN